MKHVANSGGLLAPVEQGSLKAASLTKGHTNQVLRCVHYGVETEYDILAVDGKMNKEKVAQTDVEFGRAVDEGLEWLILGPVIEEKWPTLIQMVQSEGNATAQLQRHEHEIQVMGRIFNEASTHQSVLGIVNWDHIMRSVVRSKPPCKDYAHQLCKFVEYCSGGVDGALLFDLQSFHRMHCATTRALRGDMWGGVSQL